MVELYSPRDCTWVFRHLDPPEETWHDLGQAGTISRILQNRRDYSFQAWLWVSCHTLYTPPHSVLDFVYRMARRLIGPCRAYSCLRLAANEYLYDSPIQDLSCRNRLNGCPLVPQAHDLQCFIYEVVRANHSPQQVQDYLRHVWGVFRAGLPRVHKEDLTPQELGRLELLVRSLGLLDELTRNESLSHESATSLYQLVLDMLDLECFSWSQALEDGVQYRGGGVLERDGTAIQTIYTLLGRHHV